MNNKTLTTEQAVALLKIQGLLAAAYDISRHTNHDLLSYLIKMARMEANSPFDPRSEIDDCAEDNDDMGQH
ncbi:hypothetical protein OEG84_06290 [Hoeflea sp. G2-23]|uniref:Uncharacterized protein n=1 Tax=Hoeflea algicola TaxID=2983763 RepID=A0ABT3Z6C5_9HYPH|nr:hypothetical protein [Hoeflea algicola]MCY0147327.1 hypothetical protein [Hoeflea algicola]